MFKTFLGALPPVSIFVILKNLFLKNVTDISI